MKKLYILAALLMATTSAHAGGMSFQIEGERIRVEAPRDCNSLSCIKITAPGFNGTLGKIDLKGLGSKSKDDDVADTTPARRRLLLHPCKRQRPRQPHPSQRQPRPLPPRRPWHPPRRLQSDAAPPAPPPAPAAARRARACHPAGSGCRRSRVRPDLAARRLVHRGQQGQRSHRGMRRQSLRLCRQDRRKDPDQHEAAGHASGPAASTIPTAAATTTRRSR